MVDAVLGTVENAPSVWEREKGNFSSNRFVFRNMRIVEYYDDGGDPCVELHSAKSKDEKGDLVWTHFRWLDALQRERLRNAYKKLIKFESSIREEMNRIETLKENDRNEKEAKEIFESFISHS